MKTIYCNELTRDCSYVARGETEKDVIAAFISHAERNHTLYIAEMRSSMNDEQLKDMLAPTVRDEKDGPPERVVSL